MSRQDDAVASQWLDHTTVIRLERKAIGCFADAIRARVVTAVMKAAQKQEVVEAGFATQRPVLVVMGLRAVRRHAASGKPAEAISDVERQAQAVRNDALLATDIDRQAVPFHHADHLGIAPDSSRRGCR